MSGLRRNLYHRVELLLQNFPVVAIVGTRQCGKTMLSKQIRPDWQYIDMENPRDYDRVSSDPLLFFEQHPDSVIIDEAQIDSELFNVLRGVIDQKRNVKNRFILTGSSSLDLLEKMSETLAGRIAYVELSPLKANERFEKGLSKFYKFFEDQTFDLLSLNSELTLAQMRKHWLFGGYPEQAVINRKSYWQDWMLQYRDLYLNRDIAALFPKLNKVNYRRFLQLLAKLSGTIINKADLARNLEVSQPTIHEYLSIAEGTFLWRNLPSYKSDFSKSVIKMPKAIMRDSGLLHFLLQIHDEDNLFSDPKLGASFEGFVIEEIIRGMQAQGINNFNSYFYRTKNGAEIDLILEGAFGLIPIEIKHGSYTKVSQLTSLKAFVKTHKTKLGIVINQGNEITWLTPKIIQIPINHL